MTDNDSDKTQYTVQKLVDIGDGATAWADIATVGLSPRARRQSALGLAFAECPEDTPYDEEGKFRILDAESANVLTVRAKPPAIPELDIK